MHINRTFVVFVLLLLAAAGVTAQAPPDFSGDWVLNRQASTLPPPVSTVESGVVRIEHREPSFSFTSKRQIHWARSPIILRGVRVPALFTLSRTTRRCRGRCTTFG